MAYAFRRAAIAIAGLGAAQAVTASQLSVAQMIVDAANEYGVPPELALGIASHESGFNPSLTNANRNGTTDYGVMQLNTTVLQTYGLSTAQAMDPQTNIDTGVSLLATYLTQYNGDTSTALWAYAAGAGSVQAGANYPTQFISYVTSYQPPATLDLGTAAPDLSSVVSDASSAIASSASSVLAAFGVDPTTFDPSTFDWTDFFPAAAVAAGVLLLWSASN
jgi:transglycosylase-like protein with SLT domain